MFPWVCIGRGSIWGERFWGIDRNCCIPQATGQGSNTSNAHQIRLWERIGLFGLQVWKERFYCFKELGYLLSFLVFATRFF